MLSKEEFVQRILDGAAPRQAQKSTVASIMDGFDSFDEEETPPHTHEDTRFAQLLLEESGFGGGEALPREDVVLGDQKTNRFLPNGVTYWKKTVERPFHILLFELEKKGRELLADAFFRQTDQLEDALHRVVQDALEGFERGGAGRTADRRQGAQTETLCVVSIVDDRSTDTGRQLVCFGTSCVATTSLEAFVLREEARDWAARGDRPLAEEHLGQLYERHFKPLATGAKWQDAFVTGAERKKARALRDACRQPRLFGDAEETLRQAARDLLDEIAWSFGIRRKKANQNRCLEMIELPSNHSIAVDPDESRRAGFQNPLRGVRIYDSSERLLGFIVYTVTAKEDADRLRNELRTHNHFHNVLVIYPNGDSPELELWQGPEPLRGRLVTGSRRSRFDGDGGIVQLLSRFFVVSKSAIEKPAQLATELAWRAGHLKALAVEELGRENESGGGPLKELFDIFNQALATLSVEKFADAYAQTITYGMLAARWISTDRQKLLFARKNLAELLPSTSAFLHDLFQKLVNSNFDKNLSWLLDDITSLLARTSVAQVFHGEKDPSIHFYQDFLDAYDPQIRKDQGVYYTPDEVVSYIVRTAHASLQTDFGLPLGLADTKTWADFAQAKGLSVPAGVDPKTPFVQVLDPATGTGTFLLRVIEVIHETMQAEYARRGLAAAAAKKEWLAYVRRDLLPRINGFELMMAPYIVCHLRLGLALQETGFVFERQDRLRVFLTNTLEMHTPAQLSILGEHVAEEAKEAERVKKDAAISVIVGNPPYKTKRRSDSDEEGDYEQTGGWVTAGGTEWRGGRPIFMDFLEPLRRSGLGGHAKNIYELSMYFWRWAMWRVFDRWGTPGVVSLITPSAYLKGKGSSGVREELRRAASTLTFLDLEGDQRGARPTENIFIVVQTPVCIGTAIRSGAPERNVAARARYFRVLGSREEKLRTCLDCIAADHRIWSTAPNGWQDVLMTGGSSESLSEWAKYVDWPLVTALFPWQQSGCKAGRTWVIGEASGLLERRWSALLATTGDDRVERFKNSPTGQKADKAPLRLPPLDGRDIPILKLTKLAPPATIERLGARSFDRQWIFADSRMLDRAGPPNWYVRGDRQVYLTSLLSGVLGKGPAATASAFVPDLHYFCGRGGKDIIPLWRDPAGRTPNITASFVAALKTTYGSAPHAEGIFAYAYAVLANPGYVHRFEEELQVPGLRLPITRDEALFLRGTALGRDLLRWHTFGERFREEGDKFKLAGSAKEIASVPTTPAKYPEKHKYDERRQVLRVGDGEVGPVSPEVWNFSVSGLQVVKSWLDYRMKNGAGKKSSPLDDIRPERWTEEMTQELLELLWVLEWSVAKYPELDAWLDEVLAGALFTAPEIPKPTEAERKEPKVQRGGSLFEVSDDE